MTENKMQPNTVIPSENHVIARSEATRQSRVLNGFLDCFATLAMTMLVLAMTRHCAHNDTAINGNA